MKIKTSIFLLSLALSITGSSPANASAGWYSTIPGDVIEVAVCLPRQHSSIIYLRGSGFGDEFKIFKTMKMRLTKDHEYCGKFSREYIYPWTVNVAGGWGLSFFDPKYKKSYYGWPDGIESSVNG